MIVAPPKLWIHARSMGSPETRYARSGDVMIAYKHRYAEDPVQSV